MNKRKMVVLLTVLILVGGCNATANTAAALGKNGDLLLSVLTLPIKIVGAAVAAAIGAAAGMGMMPGEIAN